MVEAYLHCATKCWLLSRGEVGSINVYAEWVRDKNNSYRKAGTLQILNSIQRKDCVSSPSENENFKTSIWKFASDVTVSIKDLESHIHLIERVSLKDHTPVQLVPIRIIANNKLTKFDKLMIAYDASILAENSKSEIAYGKIIHGDSFSCSKIKTSLLVGEVMKSTGKIRLLLASNVPPKLVLNRHCQECAFQLCCHENATVKDDLSLLSGITGKDNLSFKTIELARSFASEGFEVRRVFLINLMLNFPTRSAGTLIMKYG